MARKQRKAKRITKLTSEEIQKKIDVLDASIAVNMDEIKELRNERKMFVKDLKAVQKKEAAEKEAEGVKEIYKLLKENGMTVDELKASIRENATETI